MPLSALQAWRIATYVQGRPSCILGRAWLQFNMEALGPDTRRIYISVNFRHLDGIRAWAHITVLEYVGPPPVSWNPTELRDGFEEFLQRFITGYECRGMTWVPRERHGDLWRFVLTVDGHLALRLQALRGDLAFELEIQLPAVDAFGFHLSVTGLGRLPGVPDPRCEDSSRDPSWQRRARAPW